MNHISNQYLVRPTRLAVAFAFAVGMIVSSFAFVNNAHAAMSNVYIILDDMTASTDTTGTVCAQTSATQTEAFVDVQFPSSFTVNGTAGNHTVDTASLPFSATAWPGIATATLVSSNTVRFPSTTLSAATLYCFNWTATSSAITTGVAGDYTDAAVELWDSGPAVLETANVALSVVSDPDLDVTATVPPSFSFSIDIPTDALGTLSVGSVTESPTPRVISVVTNAASGWTVWANEDSNAGLYSATTTTSIDTASPGTATSLSAGTAGYITGLTDTINLGSPTLTFGGSNAYDYDLGTDGAPLDNTVRVIASGDAPSDVDLAVKNRAAISALIPAGTDYVDVITFTGAAAF